MGRVGSCFDNAVSESWNSTLEFECCRVGALLPRPRLAGRSPDSSTATTRLGVTADARCFRRSTTSRFSLNVRSQTRRPRELPTGSLQRPAGTSAGNRVRDNVMLNRLSESLHGFGGSPRCPRPAIGAVWRCDRNLSCRGVCVPDTAEPGISTRNRGKHRTARFENASRDGRMLCVAWPWFLQSPLLGVGSHLERCPMLRPQMFIRPRPPAPSSTGTTASTTDK